MSAIETMSFRSLPNATGEYEVVDLPYAEDALEPFIDAQTMHIHHQRHHKGYASKLNAALKEVNYVTDGVAAEELVANLDRMPESIRTKVRNAGGGYVNHNLFFTILAPASRSGQPSGELARAIESSFGNFDECKQQLSTIATGVFGSGWGWLSVTPDKKLIVEGTPNQDSPLSRGNIPVLGIDVWEHAYYLKYQNKRGEYVENIFNVFDWDAINSRYQDAIRSFG